MATEESLHHGERRSDQRLRALFAQLLNEQETDRQRIAAELHGGVGQVMSLIKITLESAAAQIAEDSTDKAEKSIRWLIPIVVDTLAELRRISSDLRPSILDDLGMLATLTWFSRRLEKTRPELKIERNVQVEEHDIPAGLRTPLFRILQESVAELLKDEPIDLIRISLHRKRGSLHLEIASRLRNMALGREKKRKPFELLAIKERALMYGGRCTVCAFEETGGCVSVSWSAKALAKLSASATGRVPKTHQDAR